MTIQHARLRALQVLAFALLCVAAHQTQASADDGSTAPPARAIPIARAIPRTFSTYDSLIATGTAVANDQVNLYAQLRAAADEQEAAKVALATIADPRVRGGLVAAERSMSDALAVLRAEISTTDTRQAQLVAAGATTAPPSAAWKLPLAGEVSQPFGPTDFGLEPPRTYRGVFYWAFHEGVDIIDAAGTPIIAPARGHVVFVGRMMDGAEVVVLAHDNGLVSLFAHLDAGPLAPTIKAGDVVQAGDRIGAVGLTGMTTGYHLHWAVYKNGEPIDPLSTLGG